MTTERSVIETGQRFTAWYIVAAIVFIALGLFAIIEPAVAAIGIALLVGWLLIIGGVAHLVATFRGGGTGRVIFQILSAILFAVAGGYMLSQPVLAVGTLTALLGGVLLAHGVFEIVGYFRVRNLPGTGWMLFNGLAALVLCALIWVHWPSSSAWAIGTLVGVNLLFTGFTRLMVGLAGRKVLRSAASQA
ncbi:MAG TPA: HdeD family acid-resistance protein [Myxococcaceae bacterium]|nr:HdeD family acid-resistance protein [Myxococcaceae bacterium]